MKHGLNCYTNYACRCDVGRGAQRLFKAAKRAAFKSGDFAPNITHGTESSYSYGCRCDECRDAHRIYNAAAYLRRKAAAA